MEKTCSCCNDKLWSQYVIHQNVFFCINCWKEREIKKETTQRKRFLKKTNFHNNLNQTNTIKELS